MDVVLHVNFAATEQNDETWNRKYWSLQWWFLLSLWLTKYKFTCLMYFYRFKYFTKQLGKKSQWVPKKWIEIGLKLSITLQLLFSVSFSLSNDSLPEGFWHLFIQPDWNSWLYTCTECKTDKKTKYLKSVVKCKLCFFHCNYCIRCKRFSNKSNG